MMESPRYGPWHTWFACHPVRTYTHGWRWLRTVKRRRWEGGPAWKWHGWDYAPMPNNEKPIRNPVPVKPE